MSRANKERKKRLIALNKQNDGQIKKPQQVARRSTLQMYSGPLPKADDLIILHDKYPEAAKIILENFQKQTNHRMEIEKLVISKQNSRSLLGQILSFILAFSVISIGGMLLYFGRNLEGFSAIIIAAGSLVVSFLYGKKSEQKERNSKFDKLVK